MPRFFLHIENRSPDEQGTAWPSLAEAKCEAVRFAGQLICDSASTFWDCGDFGLTVTDEKGLALFSLSLIGTESPAMLGCPPSHRA